jgi:hypothetical protein
MNLIEIFSIIIIHWIADFVMQDEKWALGKSKNWKDLLSHTGMYSFSFWILINICSIGLPYYWSFYFMLITFICHTITDYFTSRIVSKRFAKGYMGGPIPNFGAFSIIGFDQVLHYVQLFITYQLLL